MSSKEMYPPFSTFLGSDARVQPRGPRKEGFEHGMAVAMPERPQGNQIVHHHDFLRLNQGFLSSPNISD